MALTVKNLPAVEIRVQFLDQEDPLEKEMVIHSSILSCEISSTEEPGGQKFMELQSWTGHSLAMEQIIS